MTGDVSDDPGLFDGRAERDDTAARPDGPVGGGKQLGVVRAGMPEEIRFVLGRVGMDRGVDGVSDDGWNAFGADAVIGSEWPLGGEALHVGTAGKSHRGRRGV